MAGFKNREELLDLLLDDTEKVIEEVIKEDVCGEGFSTNELNKLQNLHIKIRKYRDMNPKEN
ncbi:hypothetical protein ACIR03_02565 [Clostridium cochlearium]|uniref:hypothetical protein n=1 Tax=Clostridium cochlearium TaxID=1494 RepID=UPI00156E5FBE|nr:hypothetical protein [Clostridium cochlearium]MBV1816888.1 hypothetical protein [Bacteroidales bacterium MSK.15.36]MCG4571747.1 hypothetical protein [Clostridium cochlearium]MCG4579076.1 hypothetical protein [Clostridium cochlearium]NSJ90165.1 hypothetical protein [Coprococcus sp. MSK.21.13]